MPHVANIAWLENPTSTTVSSWTVPVTTAAAVGTTAVMVISASNNTGQLNTFGASDTKGNTWTLVTYPAGATMSNTGNLQGAILYAPITTALATSDTISVNHNGTGVVSFVCDVHTFDDIVSLDVTATANAASGTVMTATTASATQNAELVVMGIATKVSGQSITSGTGSVGTVRNSAATGTTFRNATLAYNYVNVAGTRTYSATAGTTGAYAVGVAAFKSSVPSQTAVPTADTSVASWTPSSGGTIFNLLADGSNATFATSGNTPTGQVLKLKLSAIGIPTDYDHHILTVKMYAINASSASAVLKIYSGATLIATSSSQTLTNTVATYTFTLNNTQAHAIVAADYNGNLFGEVDVTAA
jgi:hypothetical protein